MALRKACIKIMYRQKAHGLIPNENRLTERAKRKIDEKIVELSRQNSSSEKVAEHPQDARKIHFGIYR